MPLELGEEFGNRESDTPQFCAGRLLGREKNVEDWGVGSRAGLKEVNGEVGNHKLRSKKFSNMKQLPRTWETGKRPRKMRRNDKLAGGGWGALRPREDSLREESGYDEAPCFFMKAFTCFHMPFVMICLTLWFI